VATWKYQTVYVSSNYDNKKRAWVTTAGGKTYDSIAEALDAQGAVGWELVSVVGQMVDPGPGISYERYRAFFKKPVTNAVPLRGGFGEHR
jgi:hypothetical protein